MSVAEETGLKLALLKTPKTSFVTPRPILTLCRLETSKWVCLQTVKIQIVSSGSAITNLFLANSADPDEAIWVSTVCLKKMLLTN